MHVPKAEQRDFNFRIGVRYARQIVTRIPIALWQSFRFRPRSFIEDARFDEAMTTSVYEKFLTPELNAYDESVFADYLGEADTNYYKSDFSAVKAIRPYNLMHVAPTVSLIREKEGKREVIAIHIGELTVDRTMTNAWNTAKFFVFQGAAYSTLFTEHPNLHFPFDAINAITKSAVPMEHPLFQLLEPHLRFQLQLNWGVLQSDASVITGWRPTLYAPFTADMDDGLLELFAAGFAGVPGNAAYPAYEFRRRPKKVHGDYGVFLDRYYDVVLQFTRVVADAIPSGDEYTGQWADYIAHWIPGFPTSGEIFHEGLLGEVLAGIVWNLSIGHAVDHEAFSFDVSPEEKYLRIRLEPPTSADAPPTEAKHVTRWYDRFKMRMAHRIFFEPHTVTRLIDVKYGFEEPALKSAGRSFIEALRETERTLPVRNFMPLKRISASIQF
ncbi:MAG: hypothetical protein AAF645_23375 [Myxococcota bacterium]